MTSLRCAEGNYVISLGQLCRWLSEQAEEVGVETYAGQGSAQTPTQTQTQLLLLSQKALPQMPPSSWMVPLPAYSYGTWASARTARRRTPLKQADVEHRLPDPRSSSCLWRHASAWQADHPCRRRTPGCPPAVQQSCCVSGCRGSLSEMLMKQYNLREGALLCQ